VWLPEQGINIVAQTEAGHFFRIHYDREKVLVASKIHLKCDKNNLFNNKLIVVTKPDNTKCKKL
jgi:hypothetical protein